jgi:hypothetical protein
MKDTEVVAAGAPALQHHAAVAVILSMTGR